MCVKSEVNQSVDAKSGAERRLLHDPDLSVVGHDACVGEREVLGVNSDGETEMPRLEVGIRTVEQLIVKPLSRHGAETEANYR